TFWTPQTDDDVCRNIWKVSLAGIDESGVVPIFSRIRFPAFVRASQPAAPLPMDYSGDLGDAWKYEWLWTDVDKDMAARIDRFCTPGGHHPLPDNSLVGRRRRPPPPPAGPRFRLSVGSSPLPTPLIPPAVLP